MVQEEKPESVKEASEMVNIKLYELACKAEGGGTRQPEPPKAYDTNYKGDIQSWECKTYSHMAITCLERNSPTKRVNGKPVMVVM
jgi:hypothetical protein